VLSGAADPVLHRSLTAVIIAYTVIDAEVHILGIFYGGQDYESLI
jgi:hypothetical protein